MEGQRRAEDDAEKHEDDERLHDARETSRAAKVDDGKSDDGVRETAPGTRDRTTREIFHGQPAAADQRAAHGDGPQDDIECESTQHPARQMSRPAFERGGAGRELPAREAFAEDELEERPERQGPEQRESAAGAADGRGHDVARADAARRHDQPGTDPALGAWWRDRLRGRRRGDHFRISLSTRPSTFGNGTPSSSAIVGATSRFVTRSSFVPGLIP